MKRILGMLIFVLVMGTVLTAALLSVEYFTAPMIEKNARVTLQQSILSALGIEAGDEELTQVYEREVTVVEHESTTFYLASDGSVAFRYGGAGLWGPIEGVIALNPDGETLKGVTIIQQEETPGLGGRIGEAAYLENFEERPFLPRLQVISSGKEPTPTGIDVISGATLTSVAFIDILNDRLSEVLPVYEEAIR